MPTLRPAQWLLHSPVAALPMLAALFIQRPPKGRAAEAAFNLPDYGLLLQHHWFWLVVTLGLGAWVGWYTATQRQPVEEQDPT